ncbi:hypothetical protein [uncultured Duncaniella sp.]|uniref:hypothetical protein n=1 Tax=uncultured Duncaniella sp. TaxID=2768039 RepID=UPI0025A9DA63|nr:hypothetical protein [uncultured Duncaniella sp.]
MKTRLTAEESAKLIELGVSPERASEIKVEVEEPSEGCPNIYCSDVKRPIFTLTDILDILPKEFNVSGTSARLQVYNHPAEYWIASYVTYDGGTLTYQNPCSAEKELINALYSLLVWCLEKGYVKLN